MTVTLEWITPDAENRIVRMARVSNPAGQDEPSPRLIRYLIDHRHWSPLEMASMCVQIDTTRDIGRQLLRHRSFSFQEFSQRYADPTSLGDPVFREARMQHPTNRQASVETDDEETMWNVDMSQRFIWENAKREYCHMVEYGVAKEVARAVLPEGLTPSRMYMSGTLRSWLHFCDVRGPHDGAQKEAVEIAAGVERILSDACPNIVEAWRG